ncbi:hypothetical protein GY45DRAFT_1246518 [Cubamyces sp. BRFM 1775]|nr:hypothetical protein GY45DRAFT_1246518 [Cubamyces sp. BRFM 1775]
MPIALPTIEQIEDYLHKVEDIVASSLSAATPDLPKVTEAIHRLWQDVLRHSPQAMPALKGLGAFEVPPPPPPPPPPKSLWENTADWFSDHPWTTAGITVGLIGSSLLVGYAYPHARRRARVGAKRHGQAANGERRQVVGACFVLGGDSPLGIPLIQDLEKKGYVVIASVSTPEAVEQIESKCHGYVRALVLDPTEPEMIPYFLRSLAATMSRRFPITAAGDPHAPPTTHLYVHSVVSLLSLPQPKLALPPAPLEHLDLNGDYLAYLQATHIVPLQILQALLPLLRATPARAQDARTQGLGRQSIVVCLPAMDARVGLPFASAQAMSAAATLRGVEVLRREVRAAGLSGLGSERSEAAYAMRNVKVTVVDVGAVAFAGGEHDLEGAEGLRRVVDEWTPSEQAAYGAAFGSMLEHGGHRAIRRQPSDASVFVDTVTSIVGSGRRRHGLNTYSVCDVLGRLHELFRGDRVAVGAGAGTYAFASYLPAFLLDTILNIPYLLVSIRNALLPIPPRVITPPPLAATGAAAPPAQQPPLVQQTIAEKHEGTDSDPEPEPEHDASEAGSEADVESNEGYGSGVGESWVSLKSKPRNSTSPSRISLWLVPRPSQADKIAPIMRLKPTTPLKSPHSFPAFHPHVTLASSPDGAAVRAAIPPNQGPIPVRFKELGVAEGKYFMALYVVVHQTPGSELEKVREHLRARLGDKGAIPPVAHMSLYYIDEADREERERMAERLRSELRVLEGQGPDGESVLKLACVDDEREGEKEPVILEGFDGEEIWVVKCEGPVRDWEIMEKIPLVQS